MLLTDTIVFSQHKFCELSYKTELHDKLFTLIIVVVTIFPRLVENSLLSYETVFVEVVELEVEDVSVVNMLVVSLVVETIIVVITIFPLLVENLLLSLVTISVEIVLLEVKDVSVVNFIVVFMVALIVLVAHLQLTKFVKTKIRIIGSKSRNSILIFLFI
jgi:hypothetical protein